MKVSTTVVPVTDSAKHDDALAQDARRPVGFQKIVYKGSDGCLCCDSAGLCYQFLWIPDYNKVIAWLSKGICLEWKRDDWTAESVL